MCTRFRNPLMTAIVLAFLGPLLALAIPELNWVKPAYADGGDDPDDPDDPDDADDADDDDDSSSSSSRDGSRFSPERSGIPGFINRITRRSPAPAAPGARRSVERPAFAAAEIVSLGLSPQDLAELTQRGYRVIEQRAIAAVGATSVRLGVPRGVALETARAEVQALRAGAVVDLNHFYRVEQFAAGCTGEHCAQLSMVALSFDHSTYATCGAGAEIGMIDTGINPAHETFANSRLEMMSATPEGRDLSGLQHGTAVAALFVGAPASRSPGIVPNARVVAIDAFYSAGRDQRSDVFLLVQAMDRLADSGLRVINMSLAGPPNQLLAQMVEVLNRRGVVIVAAAGNGGPRAAPAYPAAYDTVVAVTAVDRSTAVYRRAGQGPHIDLAAPGVNVWTAASIRGARPKTGTSFATPFVSAAAAVILARNPEMTPQEVAGELVQTVLDLGKEGFDNVFGHGLVQLSGLCQGGG